MEKQRQTGGKFFSIIVPVYKVEKYLRQCIDSLLVQSFTDFEVILVDDGSPDQCPQLCEKYKEKDGRIHVIHKANGGLSEARNYGLMCASGTYTLFVDSDDYIEDVSFLQNAYDKLADENYDLLIYGFRKYCEWNGTYKRGSCFHTGYFFEGDMYEVIAHDLYVLSAWGKIIRTGILKSREIEFRKGVCSEDMEWTVRLAAEVNKVCVLNFESYVYRKREGSITDSITEKNIHDIEKNIVICRRIIRNIKKEKLRTALYIYTTRFISMYLILLSQLNKKERQKHREFAGRAVAGLRYGNRRREKIIYRMCQLSGIQFTIFLLNAASNIRKKKSTKKGTKN